MKLGLGISNKGTVKWFNNVRGWGFIVDEDTGEDIFVHYTSMTLHSEKYRTLQTGDKVEYMIEEDENGRKKASWLIKK